MELEKLFKSFEDLKEKASVKAVFGEPETIGEKTIIPIARVGCGFGMGFGEGKSPAEEEGEEAPTGRGGGGGGGAWARPVAVLEVTPEETRLIPVVDAGRITLAGICTGALFLLFVARPLVKLLGQKKEVG